MADVVFVLDGSGSIRDSNFEEVKSFVQLVVETFEISSTNTRVGLIEFGDNATVLFDLRQYSDKEDVKEAVRRIPYFRESKCRTPLHGHRLRTPATDTNNEHHQRTSLQQFDNLLYNKFTTNGRKFATSQHLDMSRCWALALRCGKFVVELLWARPLMVL